MDAGDSHSGPPACVASILNRYTVSAAHAKFCALVLLDSAFRYGVVG